MTVSSLPPIGVANELREEEFLDALTPLFEGRTPLGRALARRRPFASWEALLEVAEKSIEALGEEERVAVVDSHPRLGESAAALARRSRRSYEEQGYGKGGGGSAAEESPARRRLRERALEYERRFGFRFVVFVNRRPPEALLPVLEARFDRPREVELETACREVLAIARDRLETHPRG